MHWPDVLYCTGLVSILSITMQSCHLHTPYTLHDALQSAWLCPKPAVSPLSRTSLLPKQKTLSTLPLINALYRTIVVPYRGAYSSVRLGIGTSPSPPSIDSIDSIPWEIPSAYRPLANGWTLAQRPCRCLVLPPHSPYPCIASANHPSLQSS